MNIKPETVKEIIDTLREDLGEGLVATDIWSATEVKPLVRNRDLKSSPRSIALFDQVTRKLDKTLKGAEFPGIGSYYLINLANSQMVVVLVLETYRQYILIDLSKTTMGILMSVAIPNLLNVLSKTTKSAGAAGLLQQLDSWSTNILARYPWRIR